MCVFIYLEVFLNDDTHAVHVYNVCGRSVLKES